MCCLPQEVGEVFRADKLIRGGREGDGVFKVVFYSDFSVMVA